MLSRKIFDGLRINEKLSSYFEGLDDYDDPYFIMISCESDISLAVKSVMVAVRAHEDDIYGCESFELNSLLTLISINCEVEVIKKLSTAILESVNSKELIVHISVFHHNSLGEPLETFKWSTQLLEEVIQESENKSAIEINDFSDRENWPGIERYRK
jgi:hypothetical protein